MYVNYDRLEGSPDNPEMCFYNYRAGEGLERVVIKRDTHETEAKRVEETVESREFPKLIDLSVNLISYINAQNVEFVKQTRVEDQSEFDRVNRKRTAKGKKPIRSPKSYYWINIKKTHVNYDDKGGEGEELKWRVWVRGHMWHYRDGPWMWVEPHVKGPKDAPWKHNRYAALYQNFRHLLPRRGDESL
jgi:hypothetical protein